MSDISAAIGVAQMKKIERIIKRKQELAKYWDNLLDQMDFISKPHNSKKCFHVYQSYVAMVDKKINRNAVIEKMAEEGIQTQIGTYASHIQPVYRYKKKCRVSFDIYNRAIALPHYYSLNNKDIDEISGILPKILKGAS